MHTSIDNPHRTTVAHHKTRRGPREHYAQMGGGFSESGPTTVSPFGNVPYHLANSSANNFALPMGTAFGLGGGRHYNDLMSNINSGQDQGPLAGFIKQAQGYLPQMFGDAQHLSGQLTSQANQGFGNYQDAVNSFMSQLPNLQGKVAAASGPNAGLPYANQLAQQAFDPISSNAQYQNTLKSALDGSRAGAAARGTLDSGAAQANEERMARDLGSTFAQNQTANQQNATQILGGLSAQDAATRQQGAGLESQIASLGPQAQQSLFAAMPQLAALLTGAQQLPFQALQQQQGFLQAAQNPLMSLLQMVAPVVSQHSWSFNQSGGI